MKWFNAFWVYLFTVVLFHVNLFDKIWLPTESLIIFSLFFVPVLVYYILEWRKKRKEWFFDIKDPIVR